MSQKGVIYILTNPSFPNYIKIGYATDIEKRLKQLNRSETIPFAFRVYAIYKVESALKDKELHKLIDTLNPDLRSIETFDGKERVKEFYAMPPERGYEILESIAKITGTTDRLMRMKPEGHEVLDEEIAEDVVKEAKRGPFRFSMCDIKPEDWVYFLNDSKIKAKVVDDRHVEYDGETTSLSALAQMLLGTNHPVQGPLYFTHNGKVLAEIRAENEKNEK